MPVVYRLSVEDYFPAGLPYNEGRQIAIWAAQAGADALHVTAGPIIAHCRPPRFSAAANEHAGCDPFCISPPAVKKAVQIFR